MSPTAKKGDLALVIGYEQVPILLGRIVRVVSDPHHCTAFLRDFSSITGTVNDVEPPADVEMPAWASGVCVATQYLIPIRDPDVDVAITTEREVMA